MAQHSLSDLIVAGIRMQGVDACDVRTAYDGTTTTYIDPDLSSKYTEDDLIDGTIIVLSGAAAGQCARIGAFDESTNTISFSDYPFDNPVGWGDTVMLLTPDYPLRLLIQLANDALRDCGQIKNQINFGQGDMPFPINTPGIIGWLDWYIGGKNIIDIQMWHAIGGYAASKERVNWEKGQDSIIFPDVLPFTYEDDELSVTFEDYHRLVSAWSDNIDPQINFELVVLLLADKIIQWVGVNDANLNASNKIQAELQEARRLYLNRPEQTVTTTFLSWDKS